MTAGRTGILALMKYVPLVASLFGVLAVAAACSNTPDPEPEMASPRAEDPALPNTLTAAEVADGWTLLFDGTTMSGWRGLGRDGIPTGHWMVEDGTIRKMASGAVPTAADGQPLEGGDIMTVEAFDHFELSLEWKVAPGANSGIKYNVSEALSVSSPPQYAALGFEYQILDDDRHPDAQNGPNRTAAALYDLMGPGESKSVRPVGEFNHARIVFQGSHGEHWLNGQLVLEFDLGTPEFEALLAASKYAPIPGFADKRAGHIVLQDHGDDVWFRNIKLRKLQHP
jgi:hypothetical protein